jgi:hypothetical protein
LDFKSFFHGFELIESNIQNKDEFSNGELVTTMVGGMPLIQKLDFISLSGTLLELQASTFGTLCRQ